MLHQASSWVNVKHRAWSSPWALTGVIKSSTPVQNLRVGVSNSLFPKLLTPTNSYPQSILSPNLPHFSKWDHPSPHGIQDPKVPPSLFFSLPISSTISTSSKTSPLLQEVILPLSGSLREDSLSHASLQKAVEPFGTKLSMNDDAPLPDNLK